MGQLTMSLDDRTLKKIEDAAKLEECSLSKWAKSKLTKAFSKGNETTNPRFISLFRPN